MLPSEFRSLQGLDLTVSLLLVLLPGIQTPTGAVAHVTFTTASGSVERFQLPLVRRTRDFYATCQAFLSPCHRETSSLFKPRQAFFSSQSTEKCQVFFKVHATEKRQAFLSPVKPFFILIHREMSSLFKVHATEKCQTFFSPSTEKRQAFLAYPMPQRNI